MAVDHLSVIEGTRAHPPIVDAMEHDDAMSDATRRTRLTITALIAGVVLVVVIATIVVLTRGGPTSFDADTPEGVVQRYSQAVVDGDATAARALLTREVSDSCEQLPLDAGKLRLTLLQTTERDDDTARVRVLVATIYGSGPLGADEYESEDAFDLVKVDGDWLISVTPWQLAVCVGSGMP